MTGFLLGTSITLMGLSLIIGGLIALGAFTAPVLFTAFDRVSAGAAMTTIFRRYDVLLAVALGSIVLGEALRAWSSGWTVYWWGGNAVALVRQVALVALLLACSVSLWGINPQLEQAQQNGIALQRPETVAVKQFNRLHKTSETLYRLAVLLAVVVLVLTPWAGQGPLVVVPSDMA